MLFEVGTNQVPSETHFASDIFLLCSVSQSALTGGPIMGKAWNIKIIVLCKVCTYFPR